MKTNIIISRKPLEKNGQDKLRIKGANLQLSLNVAAGKQGDYFLYFCPALNISGYGKTDAEAESFIKVEMLTFCEDIMGMPSNERDNYLMSLGFKKERFHNKNFSKAYIDADGRLQDFDEGTLEHKLLQTG